MSDHPNQEPQQQQQAATSQFYLVNLSDLNRLSYCCDIGWMGISDESVADIFQGPVPGDDDETTPELQANPTYVIASVPTKRGVFAYGVVMGSLKSLKSKTAVKDRYKKEMPKYWTRVVRVAWLRVAMAPWESFSDVVLEGGNGINLSSWLGEVGAGFLSATQSVSSVPGTEGSGASNWFKLPPRTGEEVVAAIEAKGLTVLPHDLRAAHLNPDAYVNSRQDGAVSAMPPSSRPPEQAIPMSFGGGAHRGGAYQQQGSAPPYQAQGYYGQQQQQHYGAPQQGGYHQGGGAPASSPYGGYYGHQQQYQQPQQPSYDQYQQHQQQQQQQQAGALTADQVEEAAVAAFYAQFPEEQRSAMSDEQKASTLAYYRNYYASYVPQ